MIGCAEDIQKIHEDQFNNQGVVNEDDQPQPRSLITDQEECENTGGRWEQLPMMPYPGKWFCNLPTTDGGKPCRDNSECEGNCIATLTREEYMQIASTSISPEQSRKNEKRILSRYTIGKCDELTERDCPYTFEDGKVTHGPCA